MQARLGGLVPVPLPTTTACALLSASETNISLPQFDFTSCQGVLFVMLMVLFFGGIIMAVILPFQYVSGLSFFFSALLYTPFLALAEAIGGGEEGVVSLLSCGTSSFLIQPLLSNVGVSSSHLPSCSIHLSHTLVLS